MRLIAIIIALLIVALLVYKQTGLDSDQQAQDAQSISKVNTPKAPTNPNEVRAFSGQMNDYMKAEAAKRAAAIKEAESR